MAINSIKHKGLKLLFTKGDESKVQPHLVYKIQKLLIIIDSLEKIPDDLQSFKNLNLHKLKGDLADFWSISVTGNYRIIFKFDNTSREADDIDLLDYH